MRAPLPQVSVDNYGEWIQAVADFTVTSLNSWQWAQGSVFYLLGLWSRLVSSMPYLKGPSPSLLEANVPTITRTYITSRHVGQRGVGGLQGGLGEERRAEGSSARSAALNHPNRLHLTAPPLLPLHL